MALACGLSLGVVAAAGGHFQPRVTPSTVQQIAADIARVPCANDQRLESVVALFTRAGATPDDMATFSYQDTRNLVVRKRGTSTDVIVVGPRISEMDTE